MFSECGGGFGRAVGAAWCGLAVGAALGLAGCEAPVQPLREWTPADHGQSPEPDPSRLPAQPSAPEQGGAARAAAALWNVSCASCHGRTGRGDGPGRPPGAQLPDLTAPALLAARSDAQLAEVIRNGRGMMPSFAEKLRPEAIDALVAHVRALAAPSGAGEGAAPSNPEGAGGDAPAAAPAQEPTP